jgi:hypothetical protein
MSERTILRGALALRRSTPMDNASTTPAWHWNEPVVSDVWQAGYRYGLSRAREVLPLA